MNGRSVLPKSRRDIQSVVEQTAKDRDPLRAPTIGALGGALVPQSCRIDADGNVYVVELGIDDSNEQPRISVFDRTGRFIRVFGRGGKKPAENTTPGQVFRPKDIAFGPDGRVYIGHEVAAESHSHLILIYQPF